MQKIATQIFIYASVVFGMLGIVLVLVATDSGEATSELNELLLRLLMLTVFIILPSFALSVAGKYLNSKN